MKLRLAPIVEQLRRGGCRNVEGLLEWSRQEAAPRALPANFVVPTGEAAASGAPARVGVHDQAVEVAFAVFLVLDASRRHADGVAEDLSIEGERVKAALVGWSHPEGASACAFVRADLASADRSAVVWVLRFRCRYHIRKTS